VISAHIEIILIVTGAFTAIAGLGFIAPVPVLGMIFGKAPGDELGLTLARHWALLVFLFGALLIYCAFHPAAREPIMLTAAIEKIALFAGVFGTSLRRHPIAAIIAAGDFVIALIYLLFLAGF
jgi:hypothetical protein